jgi:hypothetical protein
MRRDALDEFFGVPAGAGGIMLDTLGGGMTGGQAIEAAEKRGQAEACRTEALPVKGTSGADRENWEALGFVFGERPEGEDLFVNVTFPEGWELKRTDHSMWNNLLDAKGRNRAGMFYKAAFYDRDAHISLNRRYNINNYASCPDGHIRITIEDAGEVIHEFNAPEPAEKRWEKRDELQAEAKAWLAENFPRWESVLAYWEPEPEPPVIDPAFAD